MAVPRPGGEIMGADARLETLMLPGALTNTPTPIEHGLFLHKTECRGGGGGTVGQAGRLALQSTGRRGEEPGEEGQEERAADGRGYRPGRARRKGPRKGGG